MTTMEIPPYVVNEEDCGGCIYFNNVTGGHSRTCDYYLRTGKHRTDDSTVKDCTEKTLGGKKEKEALAMMEFGIRTDDMRGLIKQAAKDKAEQSDAIRKLHESGRCQEPAVPRGNNPDEADRNTGAGEACLNDTLRKLYVQCAIDLAEEIRDFLPVWVYTETTKGMLSDEQLHAGAEALEACANYIQYRAAGLALNDSERETGV